MEILEDKDNFLFNRKEVKIVVKAEKNPGFEEAGKIISEQFKADKENFVVKEVQGKFGRKTFLISAFIYKSKEDKEKYEPKKAVDKGEKPAPTEQANPTQAPNNVPEENKETKTEPKEEGKEGEEKKE